MKVIVSSEALLENVEEWVHEKGRAQAFAAADWKPKGALVG